MKHYFKYSIFLTETQGTEINNTRGASAPVKISTFERLHHSHLWFQILEKSLTSAYTCSPKGYFFPSQAIKRQVIRLTFCLDTTCTSF